ncbi:MAG: PSD1 and planctomycete cytochrome C domain-containing protein [Pirellulaceae bacterium]
MWCTRLHLRSESSAGCARQKLIAHWVVGLCVCSVSVLLPVSVEAQTKPEQEQVGTAAEIEFFEKRIRPFLALECYDCHGAEKAEGNLRLDSRDGVLRGGDSGPAIVPGKADDSLLIQSIKHQHEDFQMPMDRPKLADSVIADFVQWVNLGAFDPRDKPSDAEKSPERDWEPVFAERKRWWSLQPGKKPQIPKIQRQSWSAHPVDQFILATLEANQMEPADRATPQVWLRRVHLAITGIPPTVAESREFQLDSSHVAREQVVDRLLASTHFGERWGRHWMDLVRFAESYGHEQDYDIPSAWQYRDYLIRAFNADVPYDQFAKEHIAGDLLDKPRRHPTAGFNESVIATGFWYLHQATHAPVDPLQDEADRIDNQIDVFSKTFLGLTVACARCHDHKFDAISARDYYSLSAFLRSSRQDIAYLDPDGSLDRQVSELRTTHAQATFKIRDTVQRSLKEGAPRIADYLIGAQEVLDGPTAGESPDQDGLASGIVNIARQRDLNADILRRWVDQLHNAPANAPQELPPPLNVWKKLAASDQATPVTTQTSQTAETPDAQITRIDLQQWIISGQAFLPTTRNTLLWRASGSNLEIVPNGMLHSGCVSEAIQGVTRSPSFTIDRDYLHLHLAGKGQVRLIIARYGLREFNPLLFEEMQLDINTDGRFEWRTLHRDLLRQKGKLAYLELIDNGPGSIALDSAVFSDSAQPPASVEATSHSPALGRKAWAKQFEHRAHQALQRWLEGETETDHEFPLILLARKGLLDWGSGHTTASQLANEWSLAAGQAFPDPMRVLAITNGTIEPTHVFIRGMHQQPGELVDRRGLEAISGDNPLEIAHGSGRLELAAMLTDPNHPLFDRVFVNRVWAHLFGRGLVPTVDNFGALGQLPSHAELLDHLAIWFRENGRSMKQLIRHLCLSETFAMSSEIDPHADADSAENRDPDNRLLHRRNVQRLEAEAIRDQMLTVSGTLNTQQFGPSVRTHLSPFMGDPYWLTTRGIKSGPADGDHRRSIYLETRRNFLSPLLLTFDFVAPETTVGQRHSSNVPAQALTLMNDPLVHQLAAEWARNELAEESDTQPLTPEARLERIYWRALARPPRDDETKSMIAFLRSQAEQQGQSFEAASRDPQIWTDICHVMFMLKEFIYVR